MNKLTDEEVFEYLDQFTKLMWVAARKVKGDHGMFGAEDHFNTILYNCFNAVRFLEETQEWDQTDPDFVEQSKRYIKTVIWNTKAKEGQKITDRYPSWNVKRLTDTTWEADEFAGDDISPLEELISNPLKFAKELNLSPLDNEVLMCILTDYSTFTKKSSGDINILALAEHFKLHPRKIRDSINRLRKKLKYYYDQ